MTPEEFAAYLHMATFHKVAVAFVVGMGLGLLMKILNRS